MKAVFPLVLEARAKINLWLEVGSVRADGFHLVDSIMQSVTLADRLFFRSRQDDGWCFDSDFSFDCQPQENLVIRAYEGYCSLLGRRPGLSIELAKMIPTQAGLGGGSSDAAAVLIALAKLHPLPFNLETELEALASSLGADVPFFLSGGTQRARGKGDVLKPCSSGDPIDFLVLKPPFGMPTGTAYRLLDEEPCTHRPAGGVNSLLAALAKGDPYGVANFLHNDFQDVVTRALPEAARGLAILSELGALGVAMSGSGTALFGVFPDAAACQDVKKCATKLIPSWGVWAVQTASRAIIEIES